MTLTQEIDRRRTFAIIAHPDAGKTTLTEKLLLFGGAIQMAGAVKAKGERRRARSDWLKVEQERGISVASSVMTFLYDDHIFNLLDTPGHEDFSEDTYRTLTAVDSAVMVLDAAKGIETQTLKLFEVCRMRDVPIISFVNKMDRESCDPFELLDEIERQLALDVTPATWPIGAGRNFKGCYDLFHDQLLLFDREKGDRLPKPITCSGLDDPELARHLTGEELEKLREDVAMVRELCPPFDREAYAAGHLTPVFFGSAIKNFGVRELLEGLRDYAPRPRPQPAAKRTVSPEEAAVTGFVFKIQANMDPAHRDRIAFVRLCSGQFKRGAKLKHTRSGKVMAVHNPLVFMAQDRDRAEEAFPGDIIGIPGHGALRIGDTLSEKEDLSFIGVPSFAPEVLSRARLDDPLKIKHLQRALAQLGEEGAAQSFKRLFGGEMIVGVVGPLQMDVLAARLSAEYGLDVRFEAAPFEAARWLDAKSAPILKGFADKNMANMAEDYDGAPVFLARNTWYLARAEEQFPDIRFLKVREQQWQNPVKAA